MLHAVYMIFMLVPKVASFLGPTDQVPFGNMIHYTAVVAIFLFLRAFLQQTGLNHLYRPEDPHRSFVPLLFKAVVMSARVTDCLTDIAFVRVLLHEV